MTRKLTTKCAWCGLYKWARGRWLRPNPHIYLRDITHGICPACMVRAFGMDPDAVALLVEAEAMGKL